VKERGKMEKVTKRKNKDPRDTADKIKENEYEVPVNKRIRARLRAYFNTPP